VSEYRYRPTPKLPKWKVTIHFFNADEGKHNELQTKSTVLQAALLGDAVENALEEWGMIHEEAGSFQITASTHNALGEPLL
jgi:hypothetical protein